MRVEVKNQQRVINVIENNSQLKEDFKFVSYSNIDKAIYDIANDNASISFSDFLRIIEKFNVKYVIVFTLSSGHISFIQTNDKNYNLNFEPNEDFETYLSNLKLMTDILTKEDYDLIFY